MTVKNIGKKIEAALKEKKITRSELAKKINGTHQRVSGWINGISNPSIETLEEIIKLTGKDANYFFGLPSYTGNNHIVGNNNKNITQSVVNATEIESIKQDIALLKQAIIDLQRKEERI